jgi:hypothetical protein
MWSCGKIWWSHTGHRWQYNTAHALWMLDNEDCTHTHTICNTYFFHGNNGYVNASQCYFIRILPFLCVYSSHRQQSFVLFVYILAPPITSLKQCAPPPPGSALFGRSDLTLGMYSVSPSPFILQHAVYNLLQHQIPRISSEFHEKCGK